MDFLSSLLGSGLTLVFFLLAISTQKSICLKRVTQMDELSALPINAVSTPVGFYMVIPLTTMLALV